MEENVAIFCLKIQHHSVGCSVLWNSLDQQRFSFHIIEGDRSVEGNTRVLEHFWYRWRGATLSVEFHHVQIHRTDNIQKLYILKWYPVLVLDEMTSIHRHLVLVLLAKNNNFERDSLLEREPVCLTLFCLPSIVSHRISYYAVLLKTRIEMHSVVCLWARAAFEIDRKPWANWHPRDVDHEAGVQSHRNIEWDTRIVQRIHAAD